METGTKIGARPNTSVDEGFANLSNRAKLTRGCLHCLDQCETLLKAISAEDYVAQPDGSSSVGGHMRHLLDRFHSFFNGLSSTYVDYDARKRDKAIETSLDSAHFAIASIVKRIGKLGRIEAIYQPITVKETVHHNGDSIEISSSVERELMGLLTHSIHHLALIAVIAKDFGHEMDGNFGKAPSTIVFEQS